MLGIQPSLDYDLLDIPGLEDFKIAVIPAMNRSETDEDTGVRFCEWTLTMDKIFAPHMFIELYGWYAESERETGTDVGNQLFTSSSIKHSELIVVIPCGKHLADLDNKLAHGSLISYVVISHLIKLNGKTIPIQVNTFEKCFITGVQQYLDYLIVRMRIHKKTVICTAFDQKGVLSGVGMYEVNFSNPKNDSLIFNLY